MITRATGLPVWFRFALRELRGGLGGFRIFMGCLIQHGFINLDDIHRCPAETGDA